LGVPGPVNVDNAAFALAVADLLDVPAEVAAERLSEVRDVSGRYRVVHMAGRELRLFLAKNPAGWKAALAMIPREGVLLLGANARGEDSLDTSWLWDVDVDPVQGRQVGVFGEAAEDLRLRLDYEGIPSVQARTLPELLPLVPATTPTTVVANYSAFQQLLRLF